MQDAIPLDEVSVLDQNAEALGTPTRTLMANAGAAIARTVQAKAPDGRVVVLCGSGNNGGDGLVAARHLAEDRDVEVVLAGEPGTELATEALAALPATVGTRQSRELETDALTETLSGASVLVDGLLGAGARGEPRGEVGRIVRAQQGLDAFRVAIDAPTGAGTETAFEPDVTLALGARKRLPTGAITGETLVVDIGIPERAFTHTGPGELALYPRPEASQHKGQGGFVLVIGGGPYTGAPALAAMAAMRTGADLAVVLVPETVWSAVSGFSPNIVARPLEGENLDLENPKNRVALNKWLGMVDSVVLGPGLGKKDPVGSSVPIVVDRVRELGLPLTMDADALWAMAERELRFDGDAVLTPHAGEFKLLTGRAPPGPEDVDGRVKVAQQAAQELGAAMLLKGPVDVIAEASRAKRNATGTPAMSHGGTGDVLSGIVGALQAKGLAPFDAARLGAYVAGKAGESAMREQSYGMLATDVLDAVPNVLKAYL